MLPASAVEVDSVASFEHHLDKFWRNTGIMYNPDTNMKDITNLRLIRSAHPPTVDINNQDLRQEAA